ncbi:50S ribosomal protein L9 [Buchnera aphidicola]|uniref:50S ribosomal protein L9 n=1 Tax=Buchnera aphidicola TaxID=9 RepID=UPI0020928BAA|nr:50S ribosomal protein L9 [Buchnera aphidicola]USS94108.1 50S ribosomal protein L9 [Buchnera aphidicola (Sipha maydis)]WII23656.1 50S ribosomal protein L9 [Buchnera aphidicola (Sipha maydis)]
MNIILLKKFKNLGVLGDIVQVKPGFARNFLFPQDIALPAIPENIKYFEAQKKFLEEKQRKKLSLIKERIKSVEKIKNIIISAKSGDKGKLFGSINSRDIARKFNELGIKVKKSEIKLKNGVFRSLGDYTILFQPDKKIFTEVKLTIISKRNI